jgi:hypothetical protein
MNNWCSDADQEEVWSLFAGIHFADQQRMDCVSCFHTVAVYE